MCMEAVFWSEVNKTPELSFKAGFYKFYILNTLAKTIHNYDINKNLKFGKKNVSVKFIFLVYFLFSQQKKCNHSKYECREVEREFVTITLRKSRTSC